MPALTFDDVSISYGSRTGSARESVAAVKNVNLVLPERASLGIAGESGSGKSTLAMSVLRLLPSNAKVTGKILLGETDVLKLGWGALRVVRWGEAAIVFQGAMHSLNPVQRVGAQIIEALELHAKSAYTTAELRERRVADLLKQVDLRPQTARSYPHELSGGQKQRIMIAMALACEPQLIIADEPTTALDVVVQDQVLNLLTDLMSEHGISLVMISHDLSVLAKVCDRIAVMYHGEIVEIGPAADVMTNPQHPHSQALAAAFPLIGDPRSRMNPVTREAQPVDDAAQPVVETSSEQGSVLLSATNLRVDFHTRHGKTSAVDDVSLECRAGEITALVGQSGSGKTTLAHTLLGLQAADSGTVSFLGEPLSNTAKGLKAYRRLVQLILQDPSAALNPKHSVYEAVAEGIRIHGLPGDERELVKAALTQAELTPPEQYFSALPGELSGGQRQRVVIAGALALGPQFLVADEPVASLDASVRGEILALLLRLKRDLGLGALVITHDLGLAWNIADRVLVMHRGKIVESGTAEEVLLNPQHDYTRELLSVVPTTNSQFSTHVRN